MGKSKIETESPTKKTKGISSSEEIYLEQLKNYIEAEGGYNVLKNKLFQDINNNYMHDSPLVQEIVILLRNAMQTGVGDKEKRSLDVVEDLISNCGPVMNEAFNQKEFCKALFDTALYSTAGNSMLRSENKERSCGIFLYWNLKFKEEPNYIYHQFYSNLKSKNAEFPSLPFVKEMKPIEKTKDSDKIELESVQIILEDSEQIADEADSFLRNDKNKIDTNFVRLLKAKTKKIYALSTATDVKLTSDEKNRLSKIYKRIRTLLKEIEKISETTLKERSLINEQKFLQQKMEIISPKKSEKVIPRIPIESPNKKESFISSSVESPQKMEDLLSGFESNVNSVNIMEKCSPIKEEQMIVAKDIEMEQKTSIPNSPEKPRSENVDLLGMDNNEDNGNNLNEALDSLAKEITVTPKKQLRTAIYDEELDSDTKIHKEVTPNSSSYSLSPQQHDPSFKVEAESPSKPESTTFLPNQSPKKEESINQSNSTNNASIFTNFLSSIQSKPSNYSELNNESPSKVQPNDERVETPKKENESELLDIHNEYSTPNSEKKINFKKLYSQNELSPELQGLDLNNSAKKSKTSIKSDDSDDIEFGDYS